MPTGGPVASVNLDGRSFSVAADADAQRELGGFIAEYQPNGDGTARRILEARPWKYGGLALSIDDDQGDSEFLQDLRNRKEDIAIAITHASGAVYQGTGGVTGEGQESALNATESVELSGPGSLSKQ